MQFIELIRESHEGKKLLIGGHRGHLSGTRENTISNFEELIGSEIQYMELDIQLSRDGEAVIFHDQDLSEKTSLSGQVRDYSVSELNAQLQ